MLAFYIIMGLATVLGGFAYYNRPKVEDAVGSVEKTISKDMVEASTIVETEVKAIVTDVKEIVDEVKAIKTEVTKVKNTTKKA
jgi:hypothetical protein